MQHLGLHDRFALPAKIPRELLAPRADPTLFALACKSLLFGFGFCSWEYAVADVGPHHAIVVPLRRMWQSQHVYGPIVPLDFDRIWQS